MLTKDYNDKLSRRNERIVRLWKWRWLFVAVLLVMVAACVLLGLVGTVTHSDCDSVVEYGTAPRLNARAFLGETEFRYRTENGEWTTTQPTDVGEYQAQAFSRGLAGKERFGKIMSFVIVAAELNVKVTDSEVDFGNLPESVSANLLNGDKLTCGRFDLVYGQGTVDVTPVKEDIRVVDSANRDVTGNYNINVHTKTLICHPISAKITTPSASWTYDGQPHEANEASAIGLLAGHTLCNVSTADITNVGTAPNSARYTIVDEDGNDVTVHYNTDEVWGTLTVNPRALNVWTDSAAYVYDGNSHSEKTLPVCDGLADTDSLVVKDVVRKQITDVGSVANSVAYVITNERGEDVTANYAVTEKWGTLVVERRKVTVKTASETWTYNGKAHSCEQNYSVQNLLEGCAVYFSDWVTVTNVCSADNKPRSCKVTDAQGKDVTENFSFVFDCGKLIVNKRVFCVQTENATFVFDGAPHKDLRYSVLPGESEMDGLLPGHRVAAAQSAGVTNITDSSNAVGYADNVQTYVITDGDGNDVSANYTPSGVWGKLRVKAPIKVRVHNLSKIYDGTPLTYLPTDWVVDSVPVDVQKSWVQVTLKGSLTEVGTLSLAALRAQSDVSVINGVDLLADSNNPNRVDFVGSPLTILPIPLTVSSVSIARVRGDGPLFGNVDNAACISVGSLMAGHNIAFTVTGVLTLSEQRAQNTFVAKITDDSGRDVSRCYKLEYVFGTLSWL